MGLRLLQYADVENAYDDPERVGRLAGLVRRLRDDDTVVCGSGDNLGPGVLSLVTRGRQAVDFFRAVEPDVDTFGNHDFDHGPDPLLAVVRESPQTWVCANAVRDRSQFGAGDGVQPWTVVETATHRVGILGVAHPETRTINPYAADVRFTDPIAAARSGVEALRETGVDRIVVLSHLGDDADLARAVDVDAVLGGHDHDRLVDRVDGTLVCRPGGNGRFLLEVTFGEGRPSATHHPVADGPVDPDVVSALRDRIDAAGLGDVVGTTEKPIPCDMQASKRGESEIGNLVMDAHCWKTGADVAVYAAGGFRRRPPLEGAVTAFDLAGVVPFDTELVAVAVDGAALLETFRHLALGGAEGDAPEWYFGHVSGAHLVWDDRTGQLASVEVGGEPVDSAATYRVATSEYFVDNEALFPAFGPDDVIERYGVEYEVLAEYVRETGFDPAVDGRIRRPTLDDEAVPARDWPFSP